MKPLLLALCAALLFSPVLTEKEEEEGQAKEEITKEENKVIKREGIISHLPGHGGLSIASSLASSIHPVNIITPIPEAAHRTHFNPGNGHHVFIGPGSIHSRPFIVETSTLGHISPGSNLKHPVLTSNVDRGVIHIPSRRPGLLFGTGTQASLPPAAIHGSSLSLGHKSPVLFSGVSDGFVTTHPVVASKGLPNPSGLAAVNHKSIPGFVTPEHTFKASHELVAAKGQVPGDLALGVSHGGVGHDEFQVSTSLGVSHGELTAKTVSGAPHDASLELTGAVVHESPVDVILDDVYHTPVSENPTFGGEIFRSTGSKGLYTAERVPHTVGLDSGHEGIPAIRGPSHVVSLDSAHGSDIHDDLNLSSVEDLSHNIGLGNEHDEVGEISHDVGLLNGPGGLAPKNVHDENPVPVILQHPSAVVTNSHGGNFHGSEGNGFKIVSGIGGPIEIGKSSTLDHILGTQLLSPSNGGHQIATGIREGVVLSTGTEPVFPGHIKSTATVGQSFGRISGYPSTKASVTYGLGGVGATHGTSFGKIIQSDGHFKNNKHIVGPIHQETLSGAVAVGNSVPIGKSVVLPESYKGSHSFGVGLSHSRSFAKPSGIISTVRHDGIIDKGHRFPDGKILSSAGNLKFHSNFFRPLIQGTPVHGGIAKDLVSHIPHKDVVHSVAHPSLATSQVHIRFGKTASQHGLVRPTGFRDHFLRAKKHRDLSIGHGSAHFVNTGIGDFTRVNHPSFKSSHSSAISKVHSGGIASGPVSAVGVSKVHSGVNIGSSHLGDKIVSDFVNDGHLSTKGAPLIVSTVHGGSGIRSFDYGRSKDLRSHSLR